jgi:hypothetical protein
MVIIQSFVVDFFCGQNTLQKFRDARKGCPKYRKTGCGIFDSIDNE